MMANVSNNFSFKGWNVTEFLKGNKEAAKLVVAALFGLWVPMDPALKLVSAAASKLVLDLVDFYASKVVLK